MAVIKRAQTFTPTSITPEVYSDLTTNFLMHPNLKDLTKTSNEDAIKNSIRNILLTRRGERPFNSDIGSDISAILFENITPSTQTALKTFIELAITNHEPRAKLIDVIVSPSVDELSYFITIVFSTINKTEPVTLELLLERVR